MILIFDIGKTNKKCFVFDEAYRIIWEKTTCLPETRDEDGDPSEDLSLLQTWVLDTFWEVTAIPIAFKAIHCTTYGASWVHLDAENQPVAPLYNYLKPFPDTLAARFKEAYGDTKLSLETASPFLGNLNSGLSLYQLQQQKPALFKKIHLSLHLPNYVASLFHGRQFSEITSLGCHTLLWDFQKNAYHSWVVEAGFLSRFAPLCQADQGFPVIIPLYTGKAVCGIGLHDSSAALIPYLATFEEPFCLISTGTWCISLNPFNTEPLTAYELKNDCLCYLSYSGKVVKASRYFGGKEHEEALIALTEKHGRGPDLSQMERGNLSDAVEVEYYAWIKSMVDKQAQSTRLALGRSGVRRLYVDGGFSQNPIFMRLLAAAFPEMEVYAATIAQATALGAALVLHAYWNSGPIPKQLITVKRYSIEPHP